MKKAKKTAGPLVPGRLVIGLTGGIAAGKSLALDCFRREGALVVSTDALAAEVLTVPACYNRIVRKFGRTILTNGTLDKKRLAAEVFGSPAKRKWLEHLLHPEILKRARSLIEHSRKKIAVVEVPLLFEAGLAERFTLTVCVAAPAKARLARALRRGWTKDQFKAREAAQLGAEKKAGLADVTLDNGGTPAGLRKRVKWICRSLKAAGEKK